MPVYSVSYKLKILQKIYKNVTIFMKSQVKSRVRQKIPLVCVLWPPDLLKIIAFGKASNFFDASNVLILTLFWSSFENVYSLQIVRVMFANNYSAKYVY